MRVRVAPTRIRVPDVAMLDRSNPIEQIPTRPPVAVFEILSPEDTVIRMMRKLEDYRRMGIPQIWLIEPRISCFRRYVDGGLILGSLFDERDKGIRFDLCEIEALLD